MRRDVKMGFGVGGVLLAVIIVAVLVVHRNQNKRVSFDTDGKPAQSTPDQGIDVAPSDPSKPADPPSQTAPDLTKTTDHKDQHPADDKWDALFASTTSDPKPQLRKSSPNRQQESPSSAKDSSEDNASSGSDNSTPLSSSSATGTARTHTVKSGETLSAIAMTAYGDSRQYKAILAANPGVDPAKLRPGTVLKIPPLSKEKSSAKESTSAGSSSAAPAASGDKTYIVQKDDSLYRITRKLYGTGERQEELYVLNKQVIGNDSTKLKPGMVLKLPAPPSVKQ
jgi:nucleoid-associated protein YgaU